MSNGYTVVPSIIPGPLTVGGPLTITNGQLQTGAGATPLALLNDVLQIGAASAFVRIRKDPFNNLAIFSYNILDTGITRDDAAQNANMLRIGQLQTMPMLRRINSAGTVLDGILAQSLGLSGALVTITGNVAENTVFSQLFPANTRQASTGGMLFPFLFSVNIGSALAATFRFKIGATVLFSFTRTTSADVLWWINVYQQNAAAGSSSQLRFEGGALTAASQFNYVDSPSSDQTFSFTVQLGAAGDNVVVRGVGAVPFATG